MEKTQTEQLTAEYRERADRAQIAARAALARRRETEVGSVAYYDALRDEEFNSGIHSGYLGALGLLALADQAEADTVFERFAALKQS